MSFKLKVIITSLILIILGFLTWWAAIQMAIHYKAQQFTSNTKISFLTAFQIAGVKFPPNELALLFFKNTRELQVYARDEQQWKYIKSLPIYAASGHSGPKLHEGDRQVPEGIYRITSLNPFSHYSLSMKINYPNDFDRAHAKLDHRTNLGGEIFIHGSNLSIGCIALGDEGIKQLFPLVFSVGTDHTTVIIAPNDFRTESPINFPNLPSWTQDLYQAIKTALADFPSK